LLDDVVEELAELVELEQTGLRAAVERREQKRIRRQCGCVEVVTGLGPHECFLDRAEGVVSADTGSGHYVDDGRGWSGGGSLVIVSLFPRRWHWEVCSWATPGCSMPLRSTAAFLEPADVRGQCQLLIVLRQLHAGEQTSAGCEWDGKV
jgi:hypothetical protein